MIKNNFLSCREKKTSSKSSVKIVDKLHHLNGVKNVVNDFASIFRIIYKSLCNCSKLVELIRYCNIKENNKIKWGIEKEPLEIR